MKPPNVEILQGDVLDQLATLPDKSIQCCVTSPPYWGLRDYGTASWEGGDPDNPDHHGARRTMALAFMGGQGAKAGGLGASETVSPTLKSADSGTNQVPSVATKSTIRRFTPVETELLQGFPRGWTALIGSKRHRLAADELEYYRKQLEISYGREVTDEEVHRVVLDSHRYRQCGNAVAVPVVAWIGRRLVKVHRSPSPELKAEDLLPHFLTGGQMSLWE